MLHVSPGDGTFGSMEDLFQRVHTITLLVWFYSVERKERKERLLYRKGML